MADPVAAIADKVANITGDELPVEPPPWAAHIQQKILQVPTPHGDCHMSGHDYKDSYIYFAKAEPAEAVVL